MSYILDALKKNQAEQLGEGATLRTTTRQESRSTPQWLIWILVAVLVINAGLLAWSQWPTSADKSSSFSSSAAASASETLAPTIQPSSAEQIPPQLAPIQQTLGQNIEPAQVANPILKPKLLALADLPANQQSIYLGLNFTSHLYTDIASECVVRVDGISLRAGDPFKGLKVVKITESGVIFEERRNGVPRHIEVPVLEQLLN